MNRAAKVAFSVFAVLFFLGLPVCVGYLVGGWIGGLVGGGFILMILFSILVTLPESLRECRDIRRRRQEILATRPPMSDEEFLSGLDVPRELHPVCVRVRKALAAAVGLPPELLDPAETMEEYGKLHSLGPDYMEIQFAIEEEFGFKISKPMTKAVYKIFPWRSPDRCSVGQLAAHLTAWLADGLPGLKRQPMEKGHSIPPE